MRTTSKIIGEIKAKSAERDKLVKSLERSMAIDELWPGVFDLGNVRSHYKGTSYVLTHFVITATSPDGSVESREFDPMQVPETLWPTGFDETYPKRRRA